MRRQIDDALPQLVTDVDPPELYEPVQYVLNGGGKRLRPVLVMLAARISGASDREALPAALAVEVFHNFTLVHDDIMDHASERRGRPTVHVRWDDSTAILAGDYLHALSYDLLATLERGDLARIIRAFNRMVARLCEGQTLDKVFEQRRDVRVDDYFAMISAKTGALIECAMELGGHVGGADDDQIERLRTIGRDIGRAFQVQDDLLDLVAEDARWGKTIGGDLVEGKKTYLLLRALERAGTEERSWFQRIVDTPGLEPELVDEARERMEALGILEDAAQTVRDHSDGALKELEQLPASEAADALAWLITSMRRRDH